MKKSVTRFENHCYGCLLKPSQARTGMAWIFGKRITGGKFAPVEDPPPIDSMRRRGGTGAETRARAIRYLVSYCGTRGIAQ